MDALLPLRRSPPPPLPKVPPPNPHNPLLPFPTLKLPPSLPPQSSFTSSALFLSSLDIDLPLLTALHPPLALTPPSSLRATVALLLSLPLSAPSLRRISSMHPALLSHPPSSILAVLTFLLREARVPALSLPKIIHRRPRLLISSVPQRLRPTLYFLQSLNLTSIDRHTHLLSLSVEDSLIPRMEFLYRSGFSYRDVRGMVRRFPQLFCYSVENNLYPKLEFAVTVMGRELREVREFPQYFSFSLEGRIEKRFRRCEEMGVWLTLPAMLRVSDDEFEARLDVCVGSSAPLRRSPLWRVGMDL